MTERMTPALAQFNAGELAEWLIGRTDLAFYNNGLRRCLNWTITPHGPAMRRPGTRHAAFTKSNGFVVLRRLSFAPGIAYVIEFGDGYARFFGVDRLPVESSPGVPFELTTPWGVVHLRDLRFQGSANILWVFHALFAPQEIRRLTSTSFGIGNFTMGDGPYYPENTSPITVALGATGAGLYVTTLTASAPLFSPTDLTRHWRLKAGPTTFQDGWVWMQIIAFTSTTVVSVFVHNPTNSTSPLVAWRAGLYSLTTGWPSSAVLHQERMMLGSEVVGSFPRIDGSKTGNFPVFSPGSAADDAVTYVLSADEVPTVRDLKSLRALIALTVGASFRIAPDGSYEPLTPSNALSLQVSDDGSANIAGVRAGSAIIHVDEFGQAIHEITWSIEADGLREREISVRAAHLSLDSPLVDLTWARKPFNTLVAPREDGAVMAGTYNTEQDVLAWYPWEISDGEDVIAAVESVTALRAAKGMEIWFSVRRVNAAGNTVRTVEVMSGPLRNVEPAHDAVHLDASKVFRDTPAVTLTLASTDPNGDQHFNASGSVFVSGDVGKTLKAWRITGRDRRYNMPVFTYYGGEIIAQGGTSVVVRPGKALPAFMPANTWGRTFTQVTGATHLASRVVHVWADGADIENVQVDAGGAFTLPVGACVVCYGLPYNSDIQPMPPEPPTRKGSAVGKAQRTAKYKARVVRSGRLLTQRHDGRWQSTTPRTADMPMDTPPALYTGDVDVATDVASEPPVAPILRATGGAPATIASLAPDLSTGEAG